MTVKIGRALSSLHSRLPKKSSRAALVLVGVLAPVLLTAVPAEAGGNPTVGHYLVSSPIRGWTPVGSATSDFLAASVQAGERKALHVAAVVAAGEWRSPRGELFVALTAVPVALPYAAASGIAEGCRGASHSNVTSIRAIPGVPRSAEGVCTGKAPGNLQVVEASWMRSNVLAVVEGVGLAEPVVGEVSRHQDSLLPTFGIHFATKVPAATISATTAPVAGVGAHTLDGLPTWALIGAGALIVLLAVALAVLVVRSRRAKPSIVTPVRTAGFTPPVGGGSWDDANSSVPAFGGLPQAGQQSGAFPAAQAGAWQPEPVRQAGPAAQAPWAAAAPMAAAPAAVALMPDAAVAPGWHPVGGDPHLLRYWDGNGWTAQNRWDGQNWVDEA